MATSVTPTGSVSSAAQQTIATSQLGKDDFLKLLVTQLRYQDPMNPLQGTDFVSQLAQFSSLEQLSNINTSLTQSIQSNQLMSQSLSNSMAAGLIGKDIRATGDTFTYAGTADPVRLGYTLPGSADTAVVKIYDQAGGLVRTINGTGTSAGANTFTWDGKNDQGEQLPSAKYSFKVEAADAKGTAISASPFLYGTISGVRFKADGAYFVIDGTEVALSDVLEILQT